MISVEEARRRILYTIQPLPAEQVAVGEALGRVLAEDLVSRATHPPVAVSAMDGYAARQADLAKLPARLKVMGAAPAGGAAPGRIGPGEALRIFTGGPVPEGADTIVIQENTARDGDAVLVKAPSPTGK
ncbi:MAG: molybdopterin molybdenumtransferase MoeA, partial [Tistlia sp.]